MRPFLIGTVTVLAAAFTLSACGDTSAGTSSSVLDLTSTNYIVQSTTASTVPQTTDASGAVQGEQRYKIQSGDVPFTVALKHGVTLEELTLANEATPGYGAFYVGLEIIIPAGGIIPDPSAVTTVAPVNNTTTIAGGQSNCGAGSYKIVEGDLPGKVATKFDVTLEQLNEANVNTKGYSNFIVGVTIVIPPKGGC